MYISSYWKCTNTVINTVWMRNVIINNWWIVTLCSLGTTKIKLMQYSTLLNAVFHPPCKAIKQKCLYWDTLKNLKHKTCRVKNNTKDITSRISFPEHQWGKQMYLLNPNSKMLSFWLTVTKMFVTESDALQNFNVRQWSEQSFYARRHCSHTFFIYSNK